ncbi:MAG: hypothetical protein HC859_01120 [Bacteroidia bacterium]|nr:hypothetical protein [Bacteroidia bacterium]
MLGLFDLPLTLLAIYVVKRYTNAEVALATVQLPGDSVATAPATSA